MQLHIRTLYNNMPCRFLRDSLGQNVSAESRYCTLSIEGVLCDYLRRIEQAHISTERVEGRYTHRLRLKSRPIEFGTDGHPDVSEISLPN